MCFILTKNEKIKFFFYFYFLLSTLISMVISEGNSETVIEIFGKSLIQSPYCLSYFDATNKIALSQSIVQYRRCHFDWLFILTCR